MAPETAYRAISDKFMSGLGTTGVILAMLLVTNFTGLLLSNTLEMAWGAGLCENRLWYCWHKRRPHMVR